jgi:DNA-binding NtrC family response regulator
MSRLFTQTLYRYAITEDRKTALAFVRRTRTMTTVWDQDNLLEKERAMGPANILLIDLEPHACPENHRARLQRSLHHITAVPALHTVTHFPAEITLPPPAVIVLQPSGSDNLSQMVQHLKDRWGPTPILGLLCTGKVPPATVPASCLDALDDFFTCPLRDIDVSLRVQRCLQGQPHTTSVSRAVAAQDQDHMQGLVGKSAPFLRVLRMVQGIAHADATVLIAGETGTGKELVARAIHYQSPRRGKPFIPVNCGALPDHLFENEFFGHARGAYTDASSPEKGLVAEAEAGTLFLDEVETLSASAQIKLLRFLHDREYRPLGSPRSATADVRLLAATNADLWQQVQTKRFREDLYYRLNIIGLHLPPLRERPEDIPLLANHFLRRFAHHYSRTSLQLAAAALHKLVDYAWPGNVRELESTMQRATLLAPSPVLQPEDIDLPLLHPGGVSEASAAESFRAARARVIEQFERTYLHTLLTAHRGNVTHAANHAGEARRSLQRLLKKHRLQRGTFQT